MIADKFSIWANPLHHHFKIPLILSNSMLAFPPALLPSDPDITLSPEYQQVITDFNSKFNGTYTNVKELFLPIDGIPQIQFHSEQLEPHIDQL